MPEGSHDALDVPPSREERERWTARSPTELVIRHLWDGSPVSDGPVVRFDFGSGELVVDVDAPFHADPPPTGPAGPRPGLWEHEVVELFLLGDEQRYFELELGPHGHHLALCLAGVRNVRRMGMPLAFSARIAGARWSGRARVPLEWLPSGLSRVNAYAIDGLGPQRRYWAWQPGGHATPDFHRLELFAPLPSA